MHFHVIRLVLIGVIVYLFIEYDVWDYAGKKIDDVHTKAMHDLRSVQMQYFHHY